MWCLMVTVVSECLAEGLGLSNAVTSLVPSLYLSWGLQDLCPFWEVPNIFLFFTSQPESDSIACTQAPLLLPAFTTGHCHCHHFRQSQEQTSIKLDPQSSPDTIVIHVTIFVTSKINSFTIRLLNCIYQGSEQETEIPP